MIRRLICVSALALAVLATSVPAASAATVSPEKWAPKFCTALSSWQQTISDKGSSLESELGTATAGGTDTTAILGTARDKIAAFLDDMVTATDKAAAGIKSAGSPSSPNGGKIATVFVNGFKAISKEFKSAEAQAKQLPTTSAADFQSKGTELGQTISDSANELSKGFSSVDKLDKGKKLETAVKAAPACAFLTDSSSSS